MKRFLGRLVLGILVLIALAAIIALFTGNGYLIKGVLSTYLKGHSTAHIYDLPYFDSREVKNAAPQPWKEGAQLGTLKLTPEEEGYHELFRSAAYLVIEDDEVIFEKYWGEHSKTVISNSFSMVKSVTALLIGIAHDEGLIQSLDEPACTYIPELCNVSDKNSAITIRDLLSMTSTINFDEHYGDPFGFMARATYGSDLAEVTYDGFMAQKDPGSEWEYLGGNTLLLGFIVENVTGRTLSDYMSEKLWKPMGAESPAHWALDNEGGREKSYCCFNATTRDFSRLGKLLMQRGNWGGNQLVSAEFVDEMVTPLNVPDGRGVEADHYGYQIWLDEQKGEKIINYRGMLGQYITVIPSRDLIIVRLGHSRGERDNHCPSDLKEWIKMGIRLSEEV